MDIQNLEPDSISYGRPLGNIINRTYSIPITNLMNRNFSQRAFLNSTTCDVQACWLHGSNPPRSPFTTPFKRDVEYLSYGNAFRIHSMLLEKGILSPQVMFGPITGLPRHMSLRRFIFCVSPKSMKTNVLRVLVSFSISRQCSFHIVISNWR